MYLVKVIAVVLITVTAVRSQVIVLTGIRKSNFGGI